MWDGHWEEKQKKGKKELTGREEKKRMQGVLHWGGVHPRFGPSVTGFHLSDLGALLCARRISRPGFGYSTQVCEFDVLDERVPQVP